ncbi:MAG: 4-oxalocrotonate tautomerase [Aquabacterium sp.]|jgi:4-oxalocrotonate tautomerase|nr:MAG: 4-oxalocrotonate tautomerase [Aquabacterium sp.]
MPIITIKLSALRSPELSRQVAATVLELTSRILGKNPQVTAIAIDYVDPQDWIVGGRTLAEQGKSSFFLDIKVVDETNTKAQKAQYVQEVFDAFGRLLGELHAESYVHVHDVRPTAYGYGGRTQEWRFHHPA